MRKQPMIWTVWLSCVLLGGMLRAESGAASADQSVLARALAGPLGQVEQIVFAVRLGYEDPHWYANIGYFCDDENKKAYPGQRPAGRRQALPARHPQPARHRAVRRSRRLDPRSGSPLRCPEGRVLLPAGRTRQLSPLRDQPRRNGTAATDVRAVRRLRADLPARRRPHVCVNTLSVLGELLDDTSWRALPLRRRREQHPADFPQCRTRQHAGGPARRQDSLHALGVRRPQPGRVSPFVDDQSGRQRRDGVLRQHASRDRDD